MTNKRRILVLDIETKPGIAYIWRMFKENIPNDRLIKSDGILMIGTQWLGEENVRVYTEWDHTQRGMLERVSEEIAAADALITYNGDKFDIPHIVTGLIREKLPPIAPVTHIDLFKFIRNKTRFMSKKLGYVGPEIGIGEKMKHEGFQLWVDVMNGDKAARERMAAYCAQDVQLTGELYEELKGHIPNHPNLGFHDPESCPHCNSKSTQRRGFYYTRVYQYQRHQCTNCGGWFKTGQQKIKSKASDEG